MPPDVEAKLEAWGDDIVAAAEREGDPYLVTAAIKERLAGLAAEAPEREAIYDLLIDWLASPNLNRWHPAWLRVDPRDPDNPGKRHAVQVARPQAHG